MSRLGDSWAGDPEPSAEDSSVFSLDYYRAKYREFQVLMNAADTSYQAMLELLGADIDVDLNAELESSIAEYDSKRFQIKSIAEALNAGAAVVNAAGGRMPVLSIPQTLGMPWVVPAAVVAALTAAVGISSWVSQYLRNNQELAKRAQLLAAAANLPPDVRAATVAALAAADNAVAESQSSWLAQASSGIKWIAIGFAAFLGWKVWQSSQRSRR